MGLKLNRFDADKLAGRKSQAASETPPKQEPASSTTQLEHQLATLGAQLELNTAVMAQTARALANPPEPKKRKLEAVVHRDDKGRMSRVEITVI